MKKKKENLPLDLYPCVVCDIESSVNHPLVGYVEILPNRHNLYWERANPSSEVEDQVVLDIYEVKPYSVLTQRGHIFPGDEYEMSGEAFWFGMAHLIWAGKEMLTSPCHTINGNMCMAIPSILLIRLEIYHLIGIVPQTMQSATP